MCPKGGVCDARKTMEAADTSSAGGMIGFLLEENKIHFEISLEAAERARLNIEQGC